jgi:hypothetical protein
MQDDTLYKESSSYTGIPYLHGNSAVSSVCGAGYSIYCSSIQFESSFRDPLCGLQISEQRMSDQIPM